MAERKKSKRRREQRKSRASLRSYWGRTPQDRSDPLFDFFQIPANNSFMMAKFNRAKFTFFGAEWPYYARNVSEYEGALDRCREWFVFDYQLDELGNTPARSFVDGNNSNWDAEQRKTYFGYLNNVYGVFKVIEVENKGEFTILDLEDEKSYRIENKKDVYQLEKERVLIGRIFPVDDLYSLSSTAIAITNEFSATIERDRKFIEGIDPLGVEGLLKGRGDEPQDLESLEKRLIPFLALLTDGKLTMKDLINYTDESSDPSQVLEKVKEDIDFDSDEEEVSFSKLIYSLWNYAPRTELDGASPDKAQLKRIGDMGTKEYSLIQEMGRFVDSRFNPTLYPSLQTANEAIMRLQDEWLKTPQDELEGKTPKDVILSERKLQGNDAEEINYARLNEPDQDDSDDHPLLIRP